MSHFEAKMHHIRFPMSVRLSVQMELMRVAFRSGFAVAQCHSLYVPVVGGHFLSNSRLDHGDGALIGLPAYVTRRLQSVLNASSRLIFNLRRSDHVSDALISLHWLRVFERIRSKVAILVYIRSSTAVHCRTLARSFTLPTFQSRL